MSAVILFINIYFIGPIGDVIIQIQMLLCMLLIQSTEKEWE